jgi:CheY-like chemotaxis protein
MDDKRIIFLLENSTDYLFLLDQAFRNAKLNNPLRVARYGNEAILYLKGVGIYGNREQYPLPDIIILDLAIPDGSGAAVLGWIRRQPCLDHVPAIILVQSPEKKQTSRHALDQCENAYYADRDNIDGLVRMISALDLMTNPAAPSCEEELAPSDTSRKIPASL